jgi:hypothetical protein
MHAVKTEPARFWRVFGWFVACFTGFRQKRPEAVLAVRVRRRYGKSKNAGIAIQYIGTQHNNGVNFQRMSHQVLRLLPNHQRMSHQVLRLLPNH